MRRLTVLMPFHTPFYAPLAVGVALGHFRDAGLDVSTMPAAAFGKGTIPALLDGDVEISLGGLMRSFELADRSGPIVVHFAEVCSRNGFFLLSREPRPGFQWSDLVGRTVLSFAEAPTPWQCMLTVLRRHGVDPRAVRIERERPAPDAVAAFRAGHGDFLEQPQPVVERLLAEGAAHLVASMGEATGPVPFSSYMTTPAFLAREPDVVRAFTRAVYRTQRWLAGHEAAPIAAAIAPAFPETEPAILERAVARYRGQETWARDPLLRRPGYDYLEEILLTGGLITRRARYEDLVNTDFARRAMAEAPGARE
ncbi:MAG TPA: ABC transporter substrate-binding protein [Candidatus Deferrimicrobiaceae bacterium]|nr:ABC transporter substrate-binding protein [Candidatus Deferrimicrobiaceae bacterium]